MISVRQTGCNLSLIIHLTRVRARIWIQCLVPKLVLTDINNIHAWDFLRLGEGSRITNEGQSCYQLLSAVKQRGPL